MGDEAEKVKAQKKTNALFVLACARGYLDDVKGLLDKGANSGAIDKKGISALHFACGQGRLEVVKFLWSRGVELDCEDPDGNLPLHYAIIAGKIDVLKFLLSKGAWVEGSNSSNDTALHIAARKGSHEAVKLLLEHGGKAVLKDVNKRGLTSLGEAMIGGHFSSGLTLHEAGASLKKSAIIWPLLHILVVMKIPSSLQLYLDWEGNVNEASAVDGSTALHHAAAAGDLQTAALLVKAEADLAIADQFGKQPHDYVETANKQLKKVLQTNAPPKTLFTSSKAGLLSLTSDLDEFKSMGDQSKVARLMKWADIEDPKQLEKATLEFPLELKHQIVELRKLRQILNIQQAVVELLEDDDFQKMAQNPKAKAIVGEVHEDKEAFRKFLNNPSAMKLLRTLQRFQGVVHGNGGHNVPFQTLLRDAEPNYQAKSSLRLRGMRMMLEARQRAAIAAAVAGSEAEAKENAERELDPSRSIQQKNGNAVLSHQPASSSTQGTEDVAEGSQSLTSSKEQPSTSTTGPTGETGLVEDAPLRNPWSWQRFRSDMWRALVQSSVMFVIAVAVLKVVTGKFPWEISDEAMLGIPSEAVPERPQQGSDYEF